MKSSYVFNMYPQKKNTKGSKPMLNIRQRLIYARLAPLRRPVPAMRLAKMLGGLVYRQTISAHLAKLELLRLVRFVKEKGRRGGWVALEPTGEIAQAFCRIIKDTPEDGRWHGCFASWRLPLPAKTPFPKARNAAELYAAYWLLRGLERKQKPGKKLVTVNRLVSLLGVAKQTARMIIMTLRDEGLLDGDATAPHNFVLQQKGDDPAKPKKVADDGDALDIRVNRLKSKKAIHDFVGQLSRNNYMLRRDILKVVGDALKEHKKNEQPGDGSALVLNWLGNRLRTRQAIEEGEAQKVIDYHIQSERQEAAKARLEKEVEEERRTKVSVFDVVAAKLLPGENINAKRLGMRYIESEMVAALPLLEGLNGLSMAELGQIVRPKKTPTTSKKETPKVKSLAVPSVPEKRTQDAVFMPSADHDAKVMEEAMRELLR